MPINKVNFFGKTLIDISNSSIKPNVIEAGTIALDASGNEITGTYDPEHIDYMEKFLNNELDSYYFRNVEAVRTSAFYDSKVKIIDLANVKRIDKDVFLYPEITDLFLGSSEVVEIGEGNTHLYGINIHVKNKLVDAYKGHPFWGSFNIIGDYDSPGKPEEYFKKKKINKVEYFGNTLIDLTNVTVNPRKIKEYEIAYDNVGNEIIGLGIYREDETLEKLIEGTLTSYSNPTITKIRNYVFQNSSWLESIDFQSCEVVGAGSFSDCVNLKEINLPRCTFVAPGAFSGCDSLKSFSLPECVELDVGAFKACYSTDLIDATLPVCETIGERAFSGSYLKTINAPECLKIGDEAFYGCERLKTIQVDKCETVGEWSFKECPSLSSITLPECTYIGPQAFEDCESLKVIDLPKCENVGNFAFRGCDINIIDLPNCKTIGNDAFYTYETKANLQNLYLPKCEYIGFGAFENYNFLNIVLPKCEYIGSKAFEASTGFFEIGIYLGARSVVELENVDAFHDYGESFRQDIHIRYGLIDKYLADEKWNYLHNNTNYHLIEDYPMAYTASVDGATSTLKITGEPFVENGDTLVIAGAEVDEATSTLILKETMEEL